MTVAEMILHETQDYSKKFCKKSYTEFYKYPRNDFVTDTSVSGYKAKISLGMARMGTSQLRT
jgi:hypothetical protein